jgi:hypothetical protein
VEAISPNSINHIHIYSSAKESTVLTFGWIFLSTEHGSDEQMDLFNRVMDKTISSMEHLCDAVATYHKMTI